MNSYGVRSYVETAGELAGRTNGNPIWIAIRMLTAKALWGLSAVDYALYGLNGKSFARASDYRTKKQTTELFLRINPMDARPQVEDKLEFDRLCARFNLPRPALLAVLSTKGLSADTAVPVLPDFEQLQALFEHHARVDVILKPRNDALGTGVRFVSFREAGMFDLDELPIDVQAFDRALAHDMKRDDYLVQAFVSPDPEMMHLGSGKALGTIRVLTFLDGEDVRLLYALARIPSAGNDNDNFNAGASGNLIAIVDTARGVLGPAWGRRKESASRSLECFPENPDTGRPIEGVQVPRWEEVRALVTRAAKAFPQLPSLGWDVAVSRDGVLLIEANANPDIVGAQVSSGFGARTLLAPLYRKYG